MPDSTKPPSRSCSCEPGSPLIAWDLSEIEKSSLKRFFAECSKERISTRPLIKLLSTLYGNVQVAKGHLITKHDCDSTARSRASRITLAFRAEIAWEQIWMIESISSEWLTFLEARSERL
jgi:hypothetical protein